MDQLQSGLARAWTRLVENPQGGGGVTGLIGRLGCHVGIALFVSAAGCQRSNPETPAVSVAPVVDMAQTQLKAEQGNVDAQLLLGEVYASGRGGKRDFQQAIRWYTKAADQGNASAQNGVGELAEAGQGMPPSYETAATWYRKAAEQGYAPAQYNLAVLYGFGRGTRVDDGEAAKWYLRAAVQGNALAQFNIGQRYRLGKGVPVDFVEAYKWLTLAGKTIPESLELRDELKATMKREQVAEAKKRVDTFAIPGPTGAKMPP